ncbi:MAG: hemolysin family protein [Actinomycetota bacterium]
MTATQAQILVAILGVAVAFLTSAWTNAVSRLSMARALKLRSENARKGGLLVRIAEDPRPFLASTVLLMLVGNVTAIVLVTGVLIRRDLPVAEAIAIVLMMFVLFQIVELAPRSWVLERPDQVLLFSARPVYFLGRAFGPVASFLVRFNRLFLLILPGRGLPRGPLTSEEEIKSIVEVAESEEVLEAEEAEMIHHIFDFGDTVVREVMVPRPDMVCAEAGMPLEDLLDLTLKHGFSRIPVIKDDIDNVVGIAYVKDLIKRVRNGRRARKASDVAREPVFVPESKKLLELLREMQLSKTHMAIVVDEYGGTAGLVTLEDVLEEIVGEISDEYDREEPHVEQVDDRTLRVNGRVSIDELNEKLELELPNSEWDSVGGLIGGMLGRVAVEGDRVPYEGILFEVEKTKGRRIEKVLVRKGSREEEAAGE